MELRYVELRMCYSLLCCPTQCHVELQIDTQCCCEVLRSAAQRDAVQHRAKLRYAVLRCAMLCYAGSDAVLLR